MPAHSVPSAAGASVQICEGADVNPFTIFVNAMRALWIGTPANNYVWGAVVWALVILVGFAPLAVSRYRRATAS